MATFFLDTSKAEVGFENLHQMKDNVKDLVELINDRTTFAKGTLSALSVYKTTNLFNFSLVLLLLDRLCVYGFWPLPGSSPPGSFYRTWACVGLSLVYQQVQSVNQFWASKFIGPPNLVHI
jgi:hypothetical protein